MYFAVLYRTGSIFYKMVPFFYFAAALWTGYLRGSEGEESLGANVWVLGHFRSYRRHFR